MDPTPPPKPGAPNLAPLRPLAAQAPVGRPSRAGPGGGARGGAGERPALVSLSWSRQDIENRLGIFKAGRYTSVNRLLASILAVIFAAAFLGLMAVCYQKGGGLAKRLGEVFVRPGNLYSTAPATIFFFLGVAIVAIKSFKLRLQRRALDLAAVPQHQDFVLNEATAKTVLERVRSLVDDARHFILLNRIDRALSSLHNIGGVSDVSTILQTQSENDENQIASSYALINAMVWAIPVLGFVGTVLGLTLAMGSFKVGTGDPAQIKDSLSHVISGLSTAFETTLVGLVFALVLKLLSDLMQERETDFLDECNDYCHAHVVSKLRVRRDEAKPA